MLDRVGTKMFTWHQYSPDEWDWECYDAALGLFLLIEDRYGRDAIRRITREMRTLDYPDGPALLWLCNRATGADVRRTVERFDYPDMGLNLGPFNEAGQHGMVVTSVTKGGPAERAGIQQGHNVLAVDGQVVRSMSDFERAIYERIGRRSATITMRRNGQTSAHEVELRDAK
jgi:predicted metalloprotease with PDZ domain